MCTKLAGKVPGLIWTCRIGLNERQFVLAMPVRWTNTRVFSHHTLDAGFKRNQWVAILDNQSGIPPPRFHWFNFTISCYRNVISDRVVWCDVAQPESELLQGYSFYHFSMLNFMLQGFQDAQSSNHPGIWIGLIFQSKCKLSVTWATKGRRSFCVSDLHHYLLNTWKKKVPRYHQLSRSRNTHAQKRE